MWRYILGILVVLGLPVLLAHHDRPNKTKFIALVVNQKTTYTMNLLPI